jgi:hypothetical protein
LHPKGSSSSTSADQIAPPAATGIPNMVANRLLSTASQLTVELMSQKLV